MSSQRFDESRDLPARRPEGGVPGAPPREGLRDWAQELVARSRQEGVNLTGDGGLLTAMVQGGAAGRSGCRVDRASWLRAV